MESSQLVQTQIADSVLDHACKNNEYEKCRQILEQNTLSTTKIQNAFLQVCSHGHIGLIDLFHNYALSVQHAYIELDYASGFRLAWGNEHFAAARKVFHLKPSLTMNLR